MTSAHTAGPTGTPASTGGGTAADEDVAGSGWTVPPAGYTLSDVRGPPRRAHRRAAQRRRAADTDITAGEAGVRTLVVAARQDLEIAAGVEQVLAGSAPGLCDQRHRVTIGAAGRTPGPHGPHAAGPDAGLSPPLGPLCCSVALVRAVRWLRRPGRSGGGSWSGRGSTAEVVRATGAGGEY
jgi:hypothetical protein